LALVLLRRFLGLKYLGFCLQLNLELLACEFNDLRDLLLGVECPDQSALLSHFKELNVEMFLLDTSVAHAELHEEVFEHDLLRVVD